MTPDCLVKLKPIVSDTVRAKLEDALAQGDQKAWDMTMIDAHADMQLLRRRSILNANRREALVTYITEQDKKGIKPSKSLQDLLSGSSIRQESGIVPLERYIQGVQQEFMAMNIELIDATRTTMMGLRRAGNPDFVKSVIKGIYKDADASIPKGGQAIIDAWHRTTKAILDRLNGAGADIADLKEFYIPVNHYSPSMLKAGDDAWVADALKYFNLRRKYDSPDISDEALLRKIYKNITEEADFGEELGKRQGKGLGGGHQHFRTLQPKNGEAWLEYTKKYGTHSNPIDAMKEYVSGMAKEIGLMEVLGPSYRDTMEKLVSEVKRVDKSLMSGTSAMNIFDHIQASLPRADDSITNTFRGLRALQSITKLPMSGITAMTDAAFMSTRAGYLGMNPVKVMSRHIANLATMKDYKTAGKLALITDYANHVGTAAARYSESTGFSKLERVADFALRANGLNHWTNSGKAAFGLEFLSFMADNVDNPLPRGLKSAFERYGITDADWQIMRSSITEIEGVKFLDPMSDAMEGGLRARVIGMVREEMSWAVPEPNAKVRSLTALGTQKNTIWHEVASTGMQFKTFGVSVLMNNMAMMLDKGLPTPTKLAYATSLLLTTTVMGGLVLQLKEVAKGKTPRDYDMQFGIEAMMQGGFLGVAGDLFFNDPRLFGGLPGYLAGPTVSDINRIKTIMFATKDEVLKEGGDWAKVLYPALEQEAERLAFPLKLWQTRVMAERLMLDHARRFADPDGYNAKLRREKTQMKERGQEYWSTPK